MRLSIVIPTLNESARIERSVLLAFELRPTEVIVVDGGSEDGTAEIASRAGAVVTTCRRGRGHQLNAGARIAQGEVLLFLHADCWLEPDAINQIETALHDQRVVGGAFRQQIGNDRTIFRWLEWGNAARVRWRSLPYGDQGIFLRRETFESLGGFEEVRLMEDVLLMQKLRRNRRRIELLPGPLHVDPRRWLANGVVKQTLRNWTLLSGLWLGIHPDWLAQFYK